jgi:primase-polymerase (primpol)-like protein
VNTVSETPTTPVEQNQISPVITTESPAVATEAVSQLNETTTPTPSIPEPDVTIDLEAIPEILKTHNYWAPFWVTWDSKRGRFDKGPRAGGFRNNDASTLLSFDEAFARMHGNTVLAYTLSPGKLIDTGLVVIDIDHCFTDGKLNPAAARIVQMFAGTYIESSVSGDGVHIFL